MRTLKKERWIPSRVVIAAIMITVTVVPGATAQETGAPDLGSGWELRLDEGMPVGAVVAASAEAGFVVRSFDRRVLGSPDGMDWQPVVDQTQVRDLGANDSGFVAVANREPTGSVQFSADGRAWESVDVGVSASFLRVEPGPEGFLLVGIEDCDLLARFSSNGRDWLPVDLPERCGSLLAAPMGDGWIGVAEIDDEVAVLSSDDGISWDDIDSAMPPPHLPPTLSGFFGFEELTGLASLSSDDEALVLAGAGTEGMWVSVDEGNTWTVAEIDPGRVEMTVSELGFVGVSPQRVLFSAEGTAWTQFAVDMAFHDVAANGDTLVALASDGIYTWTAPPSPLAVTGANPITGLWLGVFLLAVGAATLVLRRRLINTAPHGPPDPLLA